MFASLAGEIERGRHTGEGIFSRAALKTATHCLAQAAESEVRLELASG